MGAPPGGKGGKKGPPPRPQGSDVQGDQGKGKGKGVVPGLSTANFKADSGLIWFISGGKQHEDGHWDGDILAGPSPGGGPPIFHTEEEKSTFLADCPFLSTMFMLELGQQMSKGMTSSDTKQVKEVKMGDGRGQADEVEIKRVELSDAEKEKAHEELQALCERLGLRLDWEERAEKYLSTHSLSEQRDAFKERIQAIWARTRPFIENSKDREAARPRANTEERLKREQARAEKEAILRKKDQDVLADKIMRMTHLQSLAPADINAISWTKARELHFVDGGSGGVLLVDLQETCVVLKMQGKTAANEMLAEHVADAVGVPVAHVRVVRLGDSEHQDIVDASKQCEMFGTEPMMGFSAFFGDYPDSVKDKLGLPKDVGTNARLLERQRVGFFGILEFARGHSLMGMEGNRAMAAPAAELLQQLGCLCALDVLINNLDRVPLPVWQNEGNLGNVMVTNAGSSILGIDQQVNLVMEGQGRDAYLEKVVKVVKDSKSGGDSKVITAKLQQAILENCGSELSQTNAQHIVGGMQEGFKQIADAFRSGKLQHSLDAGEEKCLERLIIDGSCSGTKPVLDRLGAMKEFVCVVAAQIADQMEAKK